MASNHQLFVESCCLARDAREVEQIFSPRELRRLDNYTKLSLWAGAKALRQVDMDLSAEKDIGLIVASTLGPVKKACEFMDTILDDGDLCASPLAFSASVHNVLETYLSMLLGLRGPCLTISQKGGSFASALITAKSWLLAGRCEKILLGVVDEIHPIAQKISTEGLAVEHLVTDDGAVFFLLSLKGTTPMPEVSNPMDWSSARNAARQLLPLFTPQDIEWIGSDFIKTELARQKKNVFSVFENHKPEDLLTSSDEATRRKILQNLVGLFGESNTNPTSTTEALMMCHSAIARHQTFNFRTSGSTGEPVDCVHTSSNIFEEVAGVEFLFKDIRRIISVVPVHHAYGFIFALQLSKWLGIPVLTQPPLPLLHWNKILQPGDLLVAFPMFLQQLVDSDPIFPSDVKVVTATAPCPDSLLADLYRRGIASIVEIYGSSESGAIAMREQPGAPFQLLPFWDGVAAGGHLEEIVRKQSKMNILLPDIAKLQGDRFFTLSGRKDKAVQIAGINVYPAKVEKFLLQHELVKDAFVRPEGEHLKAFIVLEKSMDEALASRLLRDYLQALSAHEIPKKITFGNQLPTNAFGKKGDW